MFIKKEIIAERPVYSLLRVEPLSMLDTIKKALHTVYPDSFTAADNWKQKFIKLSPGITRTNSEAIIEKARNVSSRYSMYSMENNDSAVYKLSDKLVLFIQYSSGRASRKDKDGNKIPATDATLKYFRILPLK